MSSIPAADFVPPCPDTRTLLVRLGVLDAPDGSERRETWWAMELHVPPAPAWTMRDRATGVAGVSERTVRLEGRYTAEQVGVVLAGLAGVADNTRGETT